MVDPPRITELVSITRWTGHRTAYDSRLPETESRTYDLLRRIRGVYPKGTVLD